MKNVIIILILSIHSIFAHSTKYDSKVNFYVTSIDEAKALAGSVGKLAFIEFYADWCGPCKWMDQTTFSNPKVSTYLNNNFISIKVNIDEFDGFEAKQKYNVTSLPTMLIFNSTGKMVDRIEETLAPSKLIKILSNHNHKKNKTVIKHQLNSSPKKTRSFSAPKRIETKVNQTRTYSNSVPVRKSSHKVLVGTFRNQTSASNYHNVLKQTFIDPIFIIKDVVSSHVVYKVFMGEFQTRSEAEDYKRILDTQFNIKGSVD